MSKRNREKRQRSSRQDVVQPRSSRRWIILGAFVLLGIVGFLVLRSLRSDQPPASRTRTVWEEMPEAARQERAVAVAKRLFAAAESAARGDVWSEDLARRFRTAALPSYLRPGGAIVAAQSGIVQDRWVPVVVASNREYAANGRRSPSIFSFDAALGHFYYVADEAISDDFLGIVMLHEALHWDDLHSGREQPGSKGIEWARGEVRAHIVENLAIDRWTDGRFSKEMRNVLADPHQSEPWSQHPSLRLPNSVGAAHILAVFPAPFLSRTEESLRRGAIEIACLIEQAPDEITRAQLLLEFMVGHSHLH